MYTMYHQEHQRSVHSRPSHAGRAKGGGGQPLNGSQVLDCSAKSLLSAGCLWSFRLIIGKGEKPGAYGSGEWRRTFAALFAPHTPMCMRMRVCTRTHPNIRFSRAIHTTHTHVYVFKIDAGNMLSGVSAPVYYTEGCHCFSL